MLKAAARRLYREKRKALTTPEQMKADDLILIRLQQLQLPPIFSLLTFYPMLANKEVDTFIITDFLSFRNPGLQVAYPRTDAASCTMQAVLTDADTRFVPNAWGIPEPEGDVLIDPQAFDLVLVPLLACDSRGNRVGYGKGFYDRFLKDCRPDCIKAGLSQFEPVDRIEDADEFDVPLDLCITPDRTYVF